MFRDHIDPEEQGGEAPCFAHLVDVDDRHRDLRTGSEVVVASLGPLSGSGGAIWSLPHGGDLDANLVRLDGGQSIGTHVNDEVDVLMFVQSGHGQVMIGSAASPVSADHLVMIPKGAVRSVTAGPAGLTYLSVHRARSGLHIGTPRSAPSAER